MLTLSILMLLMNTLRLFFLLIPLSLFSQSKEKQIAFRELTVEYGLSQNSVVSISQDSVGYMWFATQDGLNKYNGKQFTHFQYQFEDVTRSTYSKLGKVYIDGDDDVWITSNSGILHKLDKNSQKFVKVSNIENVSAIIQSNSKDHYLGTFGSGLYRVNNQSQDTIQILKPEHKHLTVYDFFQYKDKVLSASENGILELKGSSYEYKKLIKNTNYSAFSAKQDTLFLGSYGKGLFYSIGNNLEFKPFVGFKNASLPNDLIIQDLLVDSRGKLWIATYGDGAYLVDFKKETVQHFVANKTNPYALHYNDVLCLYEDFTGIVWLGTDGSGLNYYDEDLVKFNVLTNKQAPDNINIDFVRAIAVNNNQIWLGTSNKGLTAINLDSEIYTMYTTTNSNISSDRIMSLNSDQDNLWIGHQNNGLQKLTKEGKFISFQAIENMSVWKIYKANNNGFWLCTLNGLILFDENQGIVKRYTTENSNLTSNSIRTVEYGEENQLWIGTESDGLFLLSINEDEISKISTVTDRIKSLYYKDNILWIGTNGNGLKSLNTQNKHLKHFTTEQGLANNVIYGILPASDNTLWLSSNNGITKATINSDTVIEIENFTNYDGLQTNEFNTGAYFKDKNGTLYFGGLEGVNWFNPNLLTYNSQKPKTIITDLEVFAKPVELTQNKVFSADQNTMTFTFSSLHYSQPDRNKYKYQLVGHDPDWISSENNNIAHYTNLTPNTYTFKVISSNYDGVWNTKPATYAFTINQPWYLSKLAILLYAILTIAVIVFVYRYLKWRWQMQLRLEFEHKETERLKKIDELKTKLYTNISHEFRTPLTLIKGPIDNQLKKKNIDKKDRKELYLVKQSANRLLNLVNQMLDLSMVDSGQQKLNVSRGNLVHLLKQLVEAFQYQTKDKNLNLRVNLGELENVWFDKDVVEKIISNLLSNAIKYAPENGEINFSASQNNGTLIFSIINQTSSVTLENLSNLFKRFYQDDEASDGVGVGLALVKELVNLSRGNIVANNIGDNRIQFSVTLPATKNAFTEEEIQIKNISSKAVNTVVENEIASKQDKTKLLIVEDNTDIKDFIVSLFKDSFVIITAKNGQEGIDKTLEKLPDIVISDIMMPVKDGIELCLEIKTNKLTSHIPVVLLTAKVGEENEIKGYKTGADAYITKPFSSEKLKLIVSQLIETRKKLEAYYSKTFNINPELAITSTENDFLKDLQKVLEEHITDTSFTSEKFSKLMLMSRTQLHRKLNAIVGMSTSEFIRSQRLKLAKKLLQESDSSISEIAYQVGFNTPSYFNKCFKEVYGTTPKEYITKRD